VGFQPIAEDDCVVATSDKEFSERIAQAKAEAEATGPMSAIGPKQTSLFALHMSAFGGKANMIICGMSAFAVAIRGKADMACCAAYVR
jgi:hypothetical protein